MSKVTRTFPLALLKEWDAPYSGLVISRVTEDVGRRWMNETTVVFQAEDDGFLYRMTFAEGKTEYQEQYWWEDFGPEVTLPRVVQHTRTVVEEYWETIDE